MEKKQAASPPVGHSSMPSTLPMNPTYQVPVALVRPRQGEASGDAFNVAAISDSTAGGLMPGALSPACQIEKRFANK
jgi:hypothetical protein